MIKTHEAYNSEYSDWARIEDFSQATLEEKVQWICMSYTNNPKLMKGILGGFITCVGRINSREGFQPFETMGRAQSLFPSVQMEIYGDIRN